MATHRTTPRHGDTYPLVRRVSVRVALPRHFRRDGVVADRLWRENLAHGIAVATGSVANTDIVVGQVASLLDSLIQKVDGTASGTAHATRRRSIRETRQNGGAHHGQQRTRHHKFGKAEAGVVPKRTATAVSSHQCGLTHGIGCHSELHAKYRHQPRCSQKGLTDG